MSVAPAARHRARAAAAAPRAGSRRRRETTAAGLAGAAALLLTIARPALAQNDSAGPRPGVAPAPSATAGAVPVRAPVPGLVRWGKWGAASLAVGLTILGIHQHDVADRAFAALVGYCGTVTCTLAGDGSYADPTAEATYQRVVRNDRAARVSFITGQIAAAGSAALFVLQLLHPTEEPNIPYHGLQVDSKDGMLRVGWRIPVGTLTGKRGGDE